MKVIRLNSEDNIAIVKSPDGISKGDLIWDNLLARDYVGFGNKVATQDLQAGQPIIKSGCHISDALHDITAGSLINETNTIQFAQLTLDKLQYNRKPSKLPTLKDSRTFMGYRNQDGSVGTRNLLAVTTTVQCVAGVVERACEIVEKEYLPNFSNVDGIVPLTHAYGCGVAIDADDAEIPIRTVRNISKNPNFGGCRIVVGLGCEKLTQDRLSLENTTYINLQEINNFQQIIQDLVEVLVSKLEVLNNRTRTPCLLKDLVIATQCGGSDAFSGLTANPLVGKVADIVTSSGGTALFSELTEVRDAVEFLADRCKNQPTFDKLIEGINWYENYLKKGGVNTSANTTPGNKAGGLSNIREKSLGSIMKSGSADIVDVLFPGQVYSKKGLNFLAGPSSDFVCGTLYLAAGANLQLFTTGRGTPYALRGLPTIKISSNSELYEKWDQIIDFDAGKLISDDSDVDGVSEELLNLIIRIASGEETLSEMNKTFNHLTLFNPAPIT